MAMITSRRKFITGVAALIAAPAIVQAERLMPVRSIARLALPTGFTINENACAGLQLGDLLTFSVHDKGCMTDWGWGRYVGDCTVHRITAGEAAALRLPFTFSAA